MSALRLWVVQSTVEEELRAAKLYLLFLQQYSLR